MQAKTYVKTGHAHRVLDRMPHAPSNFLSGQISQSGVSLDAREGGEVSLSKEETC